VHRDLDLERTIRPGLDILANEIVIALKKRSRFPRNPEIYAPGLVRTERDATLLDYELARVERIHAELGRYTFADQESFTEVGDVAPVIERQPPASPVRAMASGMGARVKAFYLEWLDEGCRPGSDPLSWGETVTADVNALLCILERISLGKAVAESKLAADPAAMAATGGERAAIRARIVHRDREAEVRALARRLAEHYAFDADQAERVFAWMIEATVDLEIDYIRMRLGIRPGE